MGLQSLGFLASLLGQRAAGAVAVYDFCFKGKAVLRQEFFRGLKALFTGALSAQQVCDNVVHGGYCSAVCAVRQP